MSVSVIVSLNEDIIMEFSRKPSRKEVLDALTVDIIREVHDGKFNIKIVEKKRR